MYRNSYNRILTKAIKTLTVECDRGRLDKVKPAVEDVYQAIDELVAFTEERVAIRARREEAKQKLRAAKRGHKEEKTDDVPISEPVAKPKKKASPATKGPKKAASGD